MKSLCAWFEIPVRDYQRAKKFYGEVLQLEIIDSHHGDVQMGMFPFEGYANSGSISLHEGHLPSTQGTMVYSMRARISATPSHGWSRLEARCLLRKQR